MKNSIVGLFAGFAFASLIAYGAVTLPNTFTSGTTIKSAEVNANFTTLRDAFNAHAIEGADPLDDGEIFIGDTATNTPTAANITGTANRVTVTNGSNTITLSGPQDIGTTSNVSFGNVTSSGNVSATGTITSTGTLTGSGLTTSVHVQATGGYESSRRDEASATTVNALSTSQTYIKLTATVTTINGAASGVNGSIIIINNDTGSSVTITDESGSATAADRFKLPEDNNITLKGQE